jgi:hypothetical protein
MKKTVTTKKEIRFEVLKDHWIKDHSTGLEWGASSSEIMTLANAKKYCEDCGGRLPTRTELETLQDLKKYNPCIDKEIFKDTKSDYYWSSTICAWDKSCAWCVSFGYGYVGSRSESDDGYVRPVRSSQ